MVRFGGVVVHGGGGLRAEVSGFGVEVESADAVGTVGAGEFHAALDALDAIGFHWFDCMLSCSRRSKRRSGSEGNVKSTVAGSVAVQG